MDLSLIISISAIIISIITLWLGELRGPNISLLEIPKFELNDETFEVNKNRYGKWTPRWFNLEPIAFVFANYGGKAGTVVDLEFDFCPSKIFMDFYERLYWTREQGSPPIMLEKGGNRLLNVSLEIETIEWKTKKLAEVLEPNLKMDSAVNKAMRKSKEEFLRFCDCLTTSKELGEVSCTVTLTKGRFRTRVTKTELFKNKVTNHYKEAVEFFREQADEWENLSPNKAELLNEIKRDLENLTKELNQNMTLVSNQLKEQNITASKLKVDAWYNSQSIWNPYARKIRWFIMESEKGLKEALAQLYRGILKYNVTIDELLSLGELRNQKHFEEANVKREELKPIMEKILRKMTNLRMRYTA